MQFRASGVAPLFLGTDGLTDVQQRTFDKLNERHTAWLNETDDKAKKKLELTANMHDERNVLMIASDAYSRGEILLSQGANTFIEGIIDKELYHYNDHVSTKEMDKGSDTTVEDGAIEVYNRVFFTDHKKLVEGDEFASLSYNSLVGHPDIVCKDTKMVKDAKSSWTKKTFPKRPEYNGTYEWQVKAYLYMLIGMTGDDSWRTGEVFHALVDTPEGLVPEWESDSLHVMSDVPDHMRVTVTKVELTDADIKHMNIRIVAARKYADIYRNEILNKNKYV
jgi:hypothetical protein